MSQAAFLGFTGKDQAKPACQARFLNQGNQGMLALNGKLLKMQEKDHGLHSGQRRCMMLRKIVPAAVVQLRTVHHHKRMVFQFALKIQCPGNLLPSGPFLTDNHQRMM